MRFKVLSMFAALLLLAACETASTSDEGGATTTTTTGTSGSTEVAPAAPAELSLQEQLINEVGDRVFFDFDKYNLKPEGRGTVEALAAWLNSRQGVTLTIEGHADERGTREYNLALGERRAASVRDYLMSLGVAAGRIQTTSRGEESPFCTESTEGCWSQNRRGHFNVIAK